MKKFFDRPKKGVSDILAKSNKAICAPSEREIVVKRVNAPKVMNRLKNAGYRIIGTSHETGPKRIWFIKRGSIF